MNENFHHLIARLNIFARAHDFLARFARAQDLLARFARAHDLLARFARAHDLLARFARESAANVAIIFALSLIPITVAAGAGLDLARGMVVRTNMAEALDAAALAVGSTNSKPASCATTATDSACMSLQTLAQQYFSANYKTDTSYGTPASVTVAVSGQSVVLTVTDQLPTTLLSAAGIKTVPVTASTTVVWGQSRLWVALVLDNTGSMSESDSGGSKMDALISASHSLLTILQNASTTAGDVQVSIVPFSKDVNVGTSNVGANWIDWTDWEAQPPDSSGNPNPPAFSDGPGDNCPWKSSGSGADGYGCVKSPGSSSTTSTIPSSGTYKGYVCPSVDSGNVNGGRTGHYYNGCYNSVAATQTSSNTICSGHSYCSCSGYSNCSCTGSNGSKVCTQTVTTSGYNHTWIVNAHSTWAGCIMDRTQDYDTTNAAPISAATDFPAENSDYCPPATVMPLGYNWTNLNNKIDSMSANGNTNQPVGLDHGMMTLVSTTPYSAPTLPSNTSQYIILLSDGLNTQNRWTTSQSSIDAREALACANAKAAGITIYTIFLDLGGGSGNSAALKSCASDSSKYYDLTTTGSVASTFTLIAQQITSLRVSK